MALCCIFWRNPSARSFRYVQWHGLSSVSQYSTVPRHGIGRIVANRQCVLARPFRAGPPGTAPDTAGRPLPPPPGRGSPRSRENRSHTGPHPPRARRCGTDRYDRYAAPAHSGWPDRAPARPPAAPPGPGPGRSPPL